MEKHIYYYIATLKNILITVFQNDWFPFRSSVFSFMHLKTLFRLPREEGVREAGPIAPKKRVKPCY